MRLIASILAIYILLLSCLPCADAETAAEAPSVAATEMRMDANNTNPHEHRNAPDLCSPFCHCSCCVVFTIVSNVVTIPVQPAALQAPVLPVPCHRRPNDISLPVWQPPRTV